MVFVIHLDIKLTDQPAHRPAFCQDSAIECRYLEEQGEVARIPVARRSIAYEIQIWHCRYPKSYGVEWLELAVGAGGVANHTVIIRMGTAHFLPIL